MSPGAPSVRGRTLAAAMFKTKAAALLLALPTVGTQDVTAQASLPTVRFVQSRDDARSLSRDPSAVLADPGAVAALSAFVAPLQKHAPVDDVPESGAIGQFIAGLPDSMMVPVQVSGVLLWVAISTDAPEDAFPPDMSDGSELAWDRYVVLGDAELPTDAQAVCPASGAGYRVWTVADVGPVEGCEPVAER